MQAIESFAVTVKDIAQMLQSFGTELAETELPDDGKDTEHLLETHTAKYRKLKVRRKGSSIVSVNIGNVQTGSLNTEIVNMARDVCIFISFLFLKKRMLSSRCQRRAIIFS